MDSIWDRLKPEISTLHNDPSRPLRAYPDPRVDEGRSAPFRVQLAAWATGEAAELHARLGDGVDLVVGHLAYPNPTRPEWLEHVLARRPEPADPSVLVATLAGALEVPSGQDARAEIRVENRSEQTLEIKTNGQLTAMVVDLRTGEIVGTFAGAQRLPLIVFKAVPGGSVAIPILVGTASLDPRLGYAVPPGRWGLDAELVTNQGRLRTAVLPFTISA